MGHLLSLVEVLVMCSVSPVGGGPRGDVGKVTQLMLPSQRIPPQGLFCVSHLGVLEREALGLAMSTLGR